MLYPIIKYLNIGETPATLDLSGNIRLLRDELNMGISGFDHIVDLFQNLNFY